MIPFNKAYSTGKEIGFINQAIANGQIAGDGYYTQACEHFFEKKYGFKKTLLTSSCTDALELAAILINIAPGDEVIMPSYSFSSTANAFLLRGAKIVFVDSGSSNPNINISLIEPLITAHTKAIVIVHYGGVPIDMFELKKLTDKHGVFLIEDAAQAIDSYYKNIPLGRFGDLATFSFHETKNITCGEGGLLVINNKKLMQRAEIIREKGTNRSAFIRKEIKQYNWVDIGSSFLPSDITAAYLYGQLIMLDEIQAKRRELWSKYFEAFNAIAEQKLFKLPYIPPYAKVNGHLFYLICTSHQARNEYVEYMHSHGIQVKSHYITLHNSPFYKKHHDSERKLPMAKIYQNRLVRLPLFYEMDENKINKVITVTLDFFGQKGISHKADTNAI